MNALQRLEAALKTVLKEFGHLFHQDAQTVLGKISADIYRGEQTLARATGDKLHSVGEALDAPVAASPALVEKAPKPAAVAPKLAARPTPAE